MKLIYLFWLFIISLNSYSQALIPNPPQLSIDMMHNNNDQQNPLSINVENNKVLDYIYQ